MINVEQFTQSTGFSDRDAFAAKKMFGGQEKTASEWNVVLKNDFTFTYVEESPSLQEGNEAEELNSKNKKNK